MLGIGNFSLWITTPFPNPMKGLVGTPSGIGLDNQLEWVVFRNLVHVRAVKRSLIFPKDQRSRSID